MINITNIFPECDVDTLLVELITQRGRANHNKGVSNVSRALVRNKDKEGPIIGVIDSDKFKQLNKDKYLLEFSEIIKNLIGTNFKEDLQLCKHPAKNHYLIYIHPEFEPWLWKQAELSGIRQQEDSEYKDYKVFENDAKKYGLSRSVSLKRFVNKVVNANPPGILMLKKWLVENDFT